MMNDLKAKEIMTVDVKTVKKDDTVSDVAKMLIQDKIGGLPVVDEDNKVIGIISETEILKKEKYIEPPRVINFLQGLIFLDDMKNLEKDLKRIAAYKVEDLMTEDNNICEIKVSLSHCREYAVANAMAITRSEDV